MLRQGSHGVPAKCQSKPFLFHRHSLHPHQTGNCPRGIRGRQKIDIFALIAHNTTALGGSLSAP